MSAGFTLSPFTRKVLVVLGLTALAVIIFYFLNVVSFGLLVLFAGILFAILLDGLARLVRRLLPIPRGGAFAIGLVVLILLIGVASAAGGVRLGQQWPRLSRQVSRSLDQLQGSLQRSDIGRKALKQVGAEEEDKGSSAGADQPESDQNKTDKSSFGATIIGHVRDFAALTVGALTDIVIVLILGIYLGATPDYYIRGSLRLIPFRNRPRLREMFATLGHGLRLWLFGRFLSMVLIGILTTAGLVVIGLPLAVLLGVIAAALTFIPYLGAILSGVPAVLLASLQGPSTALYVGLLYLGTHALEGYLITPLIQRRVVHLPPALLIAAQLLGGLMAGLMGIILAAPLAITATIIIQMLYVEDVLGDTGHVLGKD